MKKSYFFFAVCLVAVVCVMIPLAFAQNEPTPIRATGDVMWDSPVLNEDGSPCDDLSHHVVAISDIGADLRSGGVPIAAVDSDCTATACSQAMADLFALTTDEYVRVWVQAVDEAGNKSIWSEPLDVRVDRVVPGAPTGLRIKITVTVEVETP